jgi:tape measure domain-containing protein
MALTVKIRADASHFKKTIAGVEVQASGLSGVMGKLATSNLAFGAALSVAAAGAVALGAGLAFIKDASGKAAGMETLQVQFEVLTKSASKAKDLIAQFREEAIKSPLSVADYAQAAQKMLTVGTSAERVLPSLKMIGDVSLGNSVKFERLSLAYSQIISKGRLMGQENNQLAESGFAPLAMISKRTGESMAQLMKRMEDGAISSGEVTQAFKDATSAGGLFYGALERGASTTEGKIAKLDDAITGLKVAFGTGFNDGLKSALDATNNFLPKLESTFAEMGMRLGRALTNAVNGDMSAFISIGILIGEAIKEGFLEVTGTAITESIRGFLQQGSENLNPEEKMLMNNQINRFIGPQRSNQRKIEDIQSALEPAMTAVNKATTPTWAEELERNRKLTEELVSQGKTSIAELKKAFGGKSQVMFSR